MDYIGIRTATLRPNVTLGFDVYLLISGKHLLYVKRLDNIEDQRLERLNVKNVRQVFIDEKDRPAYESFLQESSEKALNGKNVSDDDRARIINGQAKAAVEEMFANPHSEDNYRRTKAAAANQVALLLKKPESLEHMLKIADFDKTTYQHCVNVATISVALATALGATEPVCNVIGTGGLLHDLGKDLTAGQAEDRDHPRKAAQLLLDKKYISRDVLDIIVLHEERIDGKGYPSGVKKLDQIFQVVSLANLYDKQVTLEGKTSLAAYEAIRSIDPAPYDDDLIEGLKELLHKV